MSTPFPSAKDFARNWYVIDAGGAVLGRVASKAAMILMGKHKPTYTPFLDTGDHVIIVNAEKIRLTGQKERDKVYRRHSGYPGGLSEISVANGGDAAGLRRELAVSGMLPKTKLGKLMLVS
jgi:large subunit ribosomal protein L13